jgi:hypothetical protein
MNVMLKTFWCVFNAHSVIAFHVTDYLLLLLQMYYCKTNYNRSHTASMLLIHSRRQPTTRQSMFKQSRWRIIGVPIFAVFRTIIHHKTQIYTQTIFTLIELSSMI